MGIIRLAFIVLVGVMAGIISARGSLGTPNPQASTPSDLTPRLVIEADGHQALVTRLLFSADDRELLSTSHDKTIRVWTVSPDGHHATLTRTLRGQLGDGEEGMLWAAALSPPEATGRQQWLAVGGSLAGAVDRYAIRLHDYRNGEVMALLRGHTDTVFALAFSPDGRWLASAGKDNTIRLWTLASLRSEQPAKPALILQGHTQHIYDLAWSKDGSRVTSPCWRNCAGIVIRCVP
jgi:WD40 repeat protein